MFSLSLSLSLSLSHTHTHTRTHTHTHTHRIDYIGGHRLKKHETKINTLVKLFCSKCLNESKVLRKATLTATFGKASAERGNKSEGKNNKHT